MRQIPFVGNFVNWLSPLENKDPIGRSLNLQSGKIATTEIIYKSHVQMGDENNNFSKLKVDKTAETSPEYDQCASNAAIESSLNTPTLCIDNIHI